MTPQGNQANHGNKIHQAPVEKFFELSSKTAGAREISTSGTTDFNVVKNISKDSSVKGSSGTVSKSPDKSASTSSSSSF